MFSRAGISLAKRLLLLSAVLEERASMV